MTHDRLVDPTYKIRLIFGEKGDALENILGQRGTERTNQWVLFVLLDARWSF